MCPRDQNKQQMPDKITNNSAIFSRKVTVLLITITQYIQWLLFQMGILLQSLSMRFLKN